MTTNQKIQPLLNQIAAMKPYAVKVWAFLLAAWKVIRPVLPVIGRALLICVQVLSMLFLAILSGVMGAGTANSYERSRVTRREMGEG